MGGIESFFFLPRKLFLVSFRLVSHFDQCPQRAPCWLILCQFKFPVDVKVICKMVSVRLAFYFID